ncbi:MAG TPA: nucleoside recognition domain-containing protein [Candidatus Sulfotelmatobacter sp.]|jgi:spore maturation protein SpmB|nr:nucleoside recognition domain-containing protein [Candidatus Sulfotelmatobacter sp.]
MNILSDVILPAGRSAIELSFFVLLPVMVVMLTLMRLLENWGVMDWLVARLAPLLRPFGLTGLGVFAALQVNLVSFAAPLATLSMMERRGTSDRHLAAAFAMVLGMAQANATFPMGAMGLSLAPVLLWSVAGGLLAAAVTYYGTARRLSSEEHLSDDLPHHEHHAGPKGTLDVINAAGAEAFRITTGAIPLLVLSLVVVTGLRQGGAVDALSGLLAPLLSRAGIDPVIIVPSLTKYLAGGTAMMGVVDHMVRAGQISPALLNASAGFLITPMDVPGVAILATAGRRVGAVWKPAVLGSLAGIALRTAAHAYLS